MDPDSGKLYTEEQIEAMTPEERDKLKWITHQEFNLIQPVEEKQRPRVLEQIREIDQEVKKRKRKAQKAARKKNR